MKYVTAFDKRNRFVRARERREIERWKKNGTSCGPSKMRRLCNLPLLRHYTTVASRYPVAKRAIRSEDRMAVAELLVSSECRWNQGSNLACRTSMANTEYSSYRGKRLTDVFNVLQRIYLRCSDLGGRPLLKWTLKVCTCLQGLVALCSMGILLVIIAILWPKCSGLVCCVCVCVCCWYSVQYGVRHCAMF